MSKNTYSTFFERHPSIGRAVAVGSLLGGGAVIVAGVEVTNANLTEMQVGVTRAAIERQQAFKIAPSTNPDSVILEITDSPAALHAEAEAHRDAAKNNAIGGGGLLGLGILSCLSEGIARVRRWKNGENKPLSLQDRSRQSVQAAKATVRAREFEERQQQIDSLTAKTQALSDPPKDLDTVMAELQSIVTDGFAQLDEEIRQFREGGRPTQSAPIPSPVPDLEAAWLGDTVRLPVLATTS